MKGMEKSSSGIGTSLVAYEPACPVDVLAKFLFTIYGRESLQVSRQNSAGGLGREREFLAVANRLHDILGA